MQEAQKQTISKQGPDDQKKVSLSLSLSSCLESLKFVGTRKEPLLFKLPPPPPLPPLSHATRGGPASQASPFPSSSLFK